MPQHAIRLAPAFLCVWLGMGASAQEGFCEKRIEQAKVCKNGSGLGVGFIDAEAVEEVVDQKTGLRTTSVLPDVDIYVAYRNRTADAAKGKAGNLFGTDVKMGNGPLTGCCIRPGEVRMSAKIDGYGSATQTVLILPNEVTKVIFKFGTSIPKGTWKLVEIEEDQGAIIIANTLDVSIYIDNEKVETDALEESIAGKEGSGSLMITGVLAGSRLVRVGDIPGKRELKVNLKKGQTLRLRADEGSVRELAK